MSGTLAVCRGYKQIEPPTVINDNDDNDTVRMMMTTNIIAIMIDTYAHTYR